MWITAVKNLLAAPQTPQTRWPENAATCWNCQQLWIICGPFEIIEKKSLKEAQTATHATLELLNQRLELRRPCVWCCHSVSTWTSQASHHELKGFVVVSGEPNVFFYLLHRGPSETKRTPPPKKSGSRKCEFARFPAGSHHKTGTNTMMKLIRTLEI